MMGKVIKSGRSFKGCVEYCMRKKEATVLYAEGVRSVTTSQATADFNMQRRLNPNLGQAVGHIALAFSPNDTPILTDARMVSIAQQYLERMRILDTQLLIVKHNDTKHQHLHIIYNRVNNQGNTISDSMLREKNVRITKALTLEQGLYMSSGKQQVNRQQLKGEDQIRYQIYDAVKTAAAIAKSMDQLQRMLQEKGINMLYKYRSVTDEIQGISFAKGDYKFKGSEIDRSMSFAKLSQSIAQRVASEHLCPDELPLADQLRAVIKNTERPYQSTERLGVGHGPSILETLLQPAGGNQQTMDDALLYHKKKKKSKSQGSYISR